MKEQHKAMFAALRAGDMDPLLENACGPLEPAKPKPPESTADPTSKNDLETARVIVGSALSRAAQPAEPSNLPVPVPPGAQITRPAPVPDAQAVIESMKSLRDSDDSPHSRRPISNPNLRRPTPSVAPSPTEAFDFDVASLDKNPPKSSHTPAAPPVRPAAARAILRRESATQHGASSGGAVPPPPASADFNPRRPWVGSKSLAQHRRPGALHIRDGPSATITREGSQLHGRRPRKTK